MYGVPENLDLERFADFQLVMISLGPHRIRFHLQKDVQNYAEISAEGKWQIRDEGGEILDEFVPNDQRECYRVHRLLMLSIVDWRLNAPDWFEIEFEEGYKLRVYDDSDEYESFSIQPGDIFV